MKTIVNKYHAECFAYFVVFLYYLALSVSRHAYICGPVNIPVLFLIQLATVALLHVYTVSQMTLKIDYVSTV